MEWEEDFGIKGEFEKDYILKVMPGIARRYGNSKTMERKNGNWKIGKGKRQWTGRMETKKLEKESRDTVKEREKLRMW